MSRILPLAAGAAFLAMLDATVTNLAIADLRHDFTGSSVSGLTWVITLYAVLFAALLAPAGRLADLVGRRLLLRAGVGVFTAASLLCALAPNLAVLLTARGLQGAGAAAMIPASLAVLLHDTLPERRAPAIGLWSAASALAAAVGPSLGGVLVDLLHWRALFYINVPVGLAIVWFAAAIPAGRAASGRLPDLPGTLLLTGGLGALALGVTQGQEWHWTSAPTLILLAGGAAATGLAIWRSARHPAPALEVSLWRNRTFAVANVASALYGAALYPWLLIGVLYLTQVWHYSELTAGLAVSPGALAAAATAVGLSRSGRLGPRAAVTGGAAVLAASGAWTVAALPAHPHFLTFWLPMGLVLGAGMGAITVGTSSAAALSVGPLRFAAGAGLNTTARQLGGALGVAALAAILSGGPHFKEVYVFCTIATALCGLAGLGLRMSPPSSPEPVVRTEAEVAA
jgi:EmrB/QacA subfamily drug resistance transporter